MKPVTKLTLLTILLSFACEKGDWYKRKCEDCTAEEPTSARVEFLLTHVSHSNYVPTVEIYEGNIEDSILIQSFETPSTRWFQSLSVNKRYTAVAKYYYFGKFYYVVSSVLPSVKFERTLCVSPCYIIYDNLLDLRMKYD